MTKLLVSVQDAGEAQTALDAGADVIDVKDPRRGSLGAPRASDVVDVVRQVAGRVPVSVACGELRDWEEHGRRQSSVEVQFSKVGLAGCAQLPDWPRRWADALQRSLAGAAAVAVVYADGLAAAAPPPQEILRQAVALGCRAVLIDTYNKSAGALLDHWSIAELESFLAQLHTAGLESAVAGSLNGQSLARVLTLRPDYVAVRGAVSRPHRAGRLDGRLVAQLVGQLQDDRRIRRLGVRSGESSPTQERS